MNKKELEMHINNYNIIAKSLQIASLKLGCINPLCFLF